MVSAMAKSLLILPDSENIRNRYFRNCSRIFPVIRGRKLRTIATAVAALCLWQFAVPATAPQLSLTGIARADDDGGGFGGFRGGGRSLLFRGFRIARFGLRLPRMRGHRSARYKNRARPIAAALVPQRSPNELIVSGLTAQDITALEQQGFAVTATRDSASLGQTVSRIEPPPGVGLQSALRRIQDIAPGATAARNDTFQRSVIGPYQPMGESCGAGCEAFAITGWKPGYLKCSLPQTIGVIDTGIDAAHPSLTGADIEMLSVRREDRRPSDPTHGTGVLSLLVGQPGSEVVGVVPRVKVLAVDAFHKSGKGDATDAFDLVAALDIMAERDIRIVNLSLAGPANPILASAVESLIAEGSTLIAAAGPSSDNGRGYPSKYPGVIAVAAIDGGLRPSRLSARGTHISYAGPGVGMSVAIPGGKARLATGTSFAAPIVSAAFATAKWQSKGDRSRTLEQIQSLAKDLGAPGRDPVYGWGLVQFPQVQTCS